MVVIMDPSKKLPKIGDNSNRSWRIGLPQLAAPAQFIHGIAAEITGDEFLVQDSFRMDRGSGMRER